MLSCINISRYCSNRFQSDCGRASTVAPTCSAQTRYEEIHKERPERQQRNSTGKGWPPSHGKPACFANPVKPPGSAKMSPDSAQPTRRAANVLTIPSYWKMLDVPVAAVRPLWQHESRAARSSVRFSRKTGLELRAGTIREQPGEETIPNDPKQS